MQEEKISEPEELQQSREVDANSPPMINLHAPARPQSTGIRKAGTAAGRTAAASSASSAAPPNPGVALPPLPNMPSASDVAFLMTIGSDVSE